MWRSRISIRATLLLFIGLLNLIIGLLVGFNVYTAWDSYQKAQTMRQILLISNYLYQAEKYISIERSRASSILFVDDDIALSMRPELEESRAKSDELIAVALQMVEDFTPDLQEELQDVKASKKVMEDIRARLERALAQEEAEEDAGEITGSYFNAATNLAEEIGRMVITLTTPIMLIDPEISQQMLFNYSVWQIAEYAGQEYAEIGWLIASNRFPSAIMRQKFNIRRGHIDQAWETAHTLALGTALYETLFPVMEEGRTHYFITFEQLKDLFYGPNVEILDAPYPVSIEMWLGIARQAVDSLFAMKDVALDQSRDYANNIERAARGDMLASFFMILLSLILSIYSWQVINNRVIRPANGMVEALYRAIHGESYQLPPITHRYDEIGKLARILEVFQLKTKEWEDHKNYLRSILGTMIDAVITIAEGGKIQLLNPAAEKMFGYSERELIGKDVSMIFPAPFATRFEEKLRHYLEDGDGDFLGNVHELEAKDKHNTSFPIELSITAAEESGHQIFVLVIRDITQRKAQEEKINRYLFDLERSNQELDDFAYIASHDLKEPLRGLHNFSRFLIEDYEDKIDMEGQNMLHTIADLTQRMEDQLNALLHYSRLGRTEMSIKETNLNDLLESVISMFAITVRERNARIVVVSDMPTVVCDHIRIKEVFQNLIGNALKYNDSKEPYVEIGCLEDHPDHPNEMVFYVRDNGIGIEKKNLESIFKIFRRLHPRSAYGGGTGSGLTIVKKIINQHKGTTWVESEGPGKGTTFFFTLPGHMQKESQAA